MKQKLVITGISGAMGRLTAERALNCENLELISFGIIAPNENQKIEIAGKKITCIPIDEVNDAFFKREKPIIIDFTHKDVVRFNWEKYYKHWGCPVIFGTIGIKKEDIIENTAPVIIGSPNLCPQIVEILKTFNSLPNECLKDVSFHISESHQSTKTEVSGTATFVANCLKKAGAIERTPIEVIRDQDTQKGIGVPEEYLNGHGWHIYEFSLMGDANEINFYNTIFALYQRITTNSDHSEKWENESKTLQIKIEKDEGYFSFTHNVNGRIPYIDGLFDTVIPAMQEMIENGKADVKDMFDI